jgi:hypothetical protein
MLREEYLKAVLPDRHAVLGVRLRPYSLGHDLLLERLGSPFYTLASVPDFTDLALAVNVCAREFHAADEWLNSPGLPAEMKAFAKSIVRDCKSKLDVPAKVDAFVEYVAAGKRVPEFRWQESEHTEVIALESPTVQVVKVALMARLGYTEAEALNCPYGLAWWNYVTLFEVEGRMRLLDREKIAVQQARADEFDNFVRKGGKPQEFKASWARN